MTRALAAAGLLAVCLTLHAGQASAQTRALSEQVGELQKAVDQLRAQTVEIPTLSAAVQELGERVGALDNLVRQLESAQASIPDAVERMDTLAAKVETLEAELAGLRVELANLEQSPARVSGDSAGGGVTYKDKFSWRTADDRFQLAVSGYLHTRYEMTAEDGEIDSSTLRVRRARVGFSGHLGSPRIKYNLLLSAIRDISLLDYHMDYRVTDWLTVRVGQYKTQFSREFMTSSTARAFLESALAVDLLRYDRDIQVGVYGDFLDKRVGYYLGVGNGAGANKVNDNLDMNVTARADVAVLGERWKYGHGDLGRTASLALALGAGVVHDLTPMPAQVGSIAVNTDVDGNGEVDNVRALSASVDAAFRWRGVEAVVEAVWRTESYGSIFEHADNAALRAAIGDGHGYVSVYGHVTYVLPVEIGSHRLLVGGRVGRTEVPFLGLGGRSSRVPGGDHALEADALVQLYNGAGQRFLGLMYSVQEERIMDEGIPVHRVILESQLQF